MRPTYHDCLDLAKGIDSIAALERQFGVAGGRMGTRQDEAGKQKGRIALTKTGP